MRPILQFQWSGLFLLLLLPALRNFFWPADGGLHFVVAASEVGIDFVDDFNFFFALPISFFIGFFGARWPLVAAAIFALLLDGVVFPLEFPATVLSFAKLFCI